ncbi:MAG: hypothetical protein KDD69_17720, partial [Bdellovibrionales bacterium]|nr:hypothetical protein [Bdellovibrionales bacterium]
MSSHPQSLQNHPSQLGLLDVAADPAPAKADPAPAKADPAPAKANSVPAKAKPPRTLAPMLQQYVDIKARYTEHLLLFQVGDFYEIFFEDARTAADVLGIRLTSRDKDQTDPIPMCGVPIHALDNYLPKLLAGGYSCVVVSQTEDSNAKKGMVRREITRIVTPGVRYEGDGLDEKRFNFLASVCMTPNGAGAVGFVDVSTGHLRVRETETVDELVEVCRKVQPAELLLPSLLFDLPVDRQRGWLRELQRFASELGIKAVRRPFDRAAAPNVAERLREVFTDESVLPSREQLDGMGEAGRAALLALLGYVQEVTFSGKPNFADFRIEEQETSVFIDAATRRNLELVEARIDGDRRNSLLAHIDSCRTAMGSRLLTDWILAPSSLQEEIEARHDAVEELLGDFDVLEGLRTEFAAVRDIDRLVSRITGLRAVPRDIAILRDSVQAFSAVKVLLERVETPLLVSLRERFDTLEDVYAELSQSLVDEPPLKYSEGGIFREGFHAEIDRLRAIRSDGRSRLAELEAAEKQRTGISGLKVKYNNVFGYFIEISKAHLAKAPADYERKQ